jgi:hypothetical protein
MAPEGDDLRGRVAKTGHAETYHTRAFSILAQPERVKDMDAQEKLAQDSQIAVAIMVGKDGDKDTLTLCNLDGPMPPECQAELVRQGCRYIGVLVIKNGVMDGAPADFNPATVHALLSAVQPFADYAREKLAPKGDGVQWLQRLHSLPDERETN